MRLNGDFSLVGCVQCFEFPSVAWRHRLSDRRAVRNLWHLLQNILFWSRELSNPSLPGKGLKNSGSGGDGGGCHVFWVCCRVLVWDAVCTCRRLVMYSKNFRELDLDDNLIGELGGFEMVRALTKRQQRTSLCLHFRHTIR